MPAVVEVAGVLLPAATRALGQNEWLGLLNVAGLRLETLYGGFAGEPLDDNSHEYVFVARRSTAPPA